MPIIVYLIESCPAFKFRVRM